MEFHVWLYKIKESDNIKASGIYESFDDVHKAIIKKIPVIHTYLTHFFTTSVIVHDKYRLFAHLANDKCIEIILGDNDCTTRKIREGHNLEKLLLNNEFGDTGYDVRTF